MSQKPFEPKVDTTKANEELDALRMQADITSNTVLRDIRKGYSAVTLFLDIFHIVLPESINLLASSLILAGQAIDDLARAETITGWGAAKAVLTFGAASMLFYRALILQQHASEIEQSINSTIQFIDVVSR